MTSTITEIASKILSSKQTLNDAIFILPSKRAGVFLKRELLAQNSKTSFAPTIYSIEEFIQEIADISVADNITLLFDFYEAYLNTPSINEKEPFESFASWASILIDDFNEIDRNLIAQEDFFNYLKDIKRIENWYLKEKKTTLIENYISFWNSLLTLYQNFTEKLLQKNQGHQGLVYREAAGNIEHYISGSNNKKHFFIGFNALNMAEEVIIKELLENGNTQIFWDADAYFMNDNQHNASVFLRKIKTTWKYYQNNSFQFIAANYEEPKQIEIIGCNKNMGQIKYVGELLNSFSEDELQETALVLADESLLLAVINSLPKNVQSVNITMGLPLKTMPATHFFASFFQISSEKSNSFYYKDVLKLLNHPLGKTLFSKSRTSILEQISKNNLINLTAEYLVEMSDVAEKNNISNLFSNQDKSPEQILLRAKNILFLLKERKEIKSDLILLQSLYKIFEVFNKMELLRIKYPFITESSTVFSLFQEFVNSTNLDFKGEPYKGLQIMGLLETRCLDFETVILVSANEEILPSGKSNKSFITFDLKLQYLLPTHIERDAVYAYHFYRLLHRAKKAYLLYNNNNESSGIITGEKSRFLLQMQYKSPESHEIIEKTISTKAIIPKKELKTIQKSTEIINEIKVLAKKGFSPSALTTYIRNPIDFYNQYLLNIRDTEEVEETIAANTLGTIVHNTLDDLYRPYLNVALTNNMLVKIQEKAEETVMQNFKKNYFEGNITSGKNLIMVKVAQYFVNRFISQEIELVNDKNEIIITQIEAKLKMAFPIDSLDFPVAIRGSVDRMDSYNGIKRIIDFKTGRVDQKDLNIKEWSLLNTDYKYSKIFQVMCYALMTYQEAPYTSAEAGIISFKNMQSGFLSLNKESVSKETLELFTEELKSLIIEICSPEIPFIEKVV